MNPVEALADVKSKGGRFLLAFPAGNTHQTTLGLLPDVHRERKDLQAH